MRITHARVWGKGVTIAGRRLDKKSPMYAFEAPYAKKVADHVACSRIGTFYDRYVLPFGCARAAAAYFSAAGSLGFFWAFTLAQRLRCASAIACRALALSLRRGLGSETAAADDLRAGLRLVPSPRRPRAWRNRAISSSRAFKIWSFTGEFLSSATRITGTVYRFSPGNSAK